MKTLIPQRELFAGAERLSPAWTITKGQKVAVCEVWSHVLGWELRLMIGGEMPRSAVVRSTPDLIETCMQWRDAMIEKGWT